MAAVKVRQTMHNDRQYRIALVVGLARGIAQIKRTIELRTPPGVVLGDPGGLFAVLQLATLCGKRYNRLLEG